MATVGAKNQPIVQTSDTFNPVSDINTLSNWVANNYASVKILTGSTVRTSLTGADLFAGLMVWEQSTGQFWLYDGSAWKLQPVGTPPRLELTRTTNATGFFTANASVTVSGWTATMNRGGFTEASGVVTVPVAGRYNITGAFGIGSQASAVGYRAFQINVNGTGAIFRQLQQGVNGLNHFGSVSANGVNLAAGDTIAIAGLQNSGTNLDLVCATAGFPGKLIVEYVGA